jgi:glycosyltransferase involved in cell wall biosynthesis
VPRRLLLLTQHFPPSSEIAGKVTARLLRHLEPYGWEPTVLTVPEDQAGAPLDQRGYTDVLENVPVERVGRWPYLSDVLRAAGSVKRSIRSAISPGNGAEDPGEPLGWAPSYGGDRSFPRLRRFLAFPDQRAGWIAPAVMHGWRMLRQDHYDAMMTVSPPQSTHLAGLALRRLVPSVPWIAQLHDPWADLNDELEPDRLVRRSMLFVERQCMTAADQVLFATDEVLEGYAERYPQVSRDRLGVLPNGYDPHDFPKADRAQRVAGAPLHFVHIGTIYGGRDPTPLLRGLATLIGAGIITPADVQIDFVGDVETRGNVQKAIDEAGLGPSTTFVGMVDHPEAIRRMMSADVLLLLAQGQPHQIPAKLYEYINADRFVLAFTSGGSARVVAETGAGRVIDEGDDVAAALADVVKLHRAGALERWHIPEVKLQPYQVSHLAEGLAARLDRMVDTRHSAQQ